MEKEHNEIVLRTYGSVWNIDRKLYSIEGLKLPFPIILNEFIYFLISAGITILLIKIFPFLNNLNWTIKFCVIPIGIMKALTSIKLDGKPAHKFIFDYIIFFFSPKKHCKFRPIDPIVNNKVKFDCTVMFKKQKIINKTDLAMEMNNGR